MRRIYDTKLLASNYQEKLSQEIISQYIMSRKMLELQGYWRIQKNIKLNKTFVLKSTNFKDIVYLVVNKK